MLWALWSQHLSRHQTELEPSKKFLSQSVKSGWSCWNMIGQKPQSDCVEWAIFANLRIVTATFVETKFRPICCHVLMDLKGLFYFCSKWFSNRLVFLPTVLWLGSSLVRFLLQLWNTPMCEPISHPNGPADNRPNPCRHTQCFLLDQGKKCWQLWRLCREKESPQLSHSKSSPTQLCRLFACSILQCRSSQLSLLGNTK